MKLAQTKFTNSIFVILGALIFGIMPLCYGIDSMINYDGAQQSKGLLYVILGALIIIGGILTFLSVFSNVFSLSGKLLFGIAASILCFMEADPTVGFSVFAGILLFALTVVDVIDIFVDNKPLSITSVIISGLAFFAFVVSGVVGLVHLRYAMLYVGYLFGYIFVGLSFFLASLINLLSQSDRKAKNKADKIREELNK